MAKKKLRLFDTQLARKPDNYPWAKKFIDVMWAGFWTPNEFNFKGDYHQFKKEIPEVEKRIIVKALSMIGQVEVSVKTFWARLGDNFPHPSMYDLGYVMANVECYHNIAYEKLLDVLNLGKVFEENLKEPIVKGRIEYLRKHTEKNFTDDKKQYIYSLILFTLFVEKVSLFSQFYIILWLNRCKNVLNDTAQQVNYTKREEEIHSAVGIKLVQTLREEYPELFDQELEDKIISESRTAFESESKIIDWILGDYEAIGDQGEKISAKVLKTFIADRLNKSLEDIGYQKIFDIDQEDVEGFYWLEEEIYGNASVDFFNSKPTEYAKKDKAYDIEDLF